MTVMGEGGIMSVESKVTPGNGITKVTWSFGDVCSLLPFLAERSTF